MIGLCILIGAVSWSPQATAWGEYGHTVVCEIAFLELDAGTREKVKALIRLDPEFRYFSTACTWPDHPRQRDEEHFINVPRQSEKSPVSANCQANTRCLFSAIKVDFQVLSNSKSSAQQQLASLKFLGHWVGDIHQPLHVAFEDDRGGNRIWTDGAGGVSLHKVWDREIIAAGMSGKAHRVGTRLQRKITARQRAVWLDSTMVDWARESHAIAISPEVGYCFRRHEGCWYGPQATHYEAGHRQRILAVDASYLKAHLPTVTERLQMAGVRLAYLLHSALSVAD